MCIDDNDFSPESKCVNCGTRCSKCNKFDKESKSYQSDPCFDSCGFREIIFGGDKTKQNLGKWLFHERHKHFTALAHNMKGYDGYFLLEYLIDNSIRPEVIYNGSKIMYMFVPRGLSNRILDSVNFLPMKLFKLPEAFGLQELKKGFFPHFFNREENVSPPVQFYAPDYMNPSERVEFLAWYNEKVQCGEHFDFQKGKYSNTVDQTWIF